MTGGDGLRSVRRALREVGDKGLGRELSAGLMRAAKPLAPEVRATALRLMPSGYAPVLSRSLRFRTAVRETRHTARVTYRVYGDGQAERRDVPTLDKGVLRHPVFGRTRRLRHHARHRATSMANPWVAQPIPAGFVSGPVDALAPRARREMDAVIQGVADKIKGS